MGDFRGNAGNGEVTDPEGDNGTGAGAPTASAMRRTLARARDGKALDVDEATVLLHARGEDLQRLLEYASRTRDAGLEAARRPNVITYSRKVFIPLTRLCRDRCGYCTFATVPHRLHSLYLEPDEILAIARQGAELGCKEALFTLGDKPEDRWHQAREWLDQHGYDDTLSYVRAMAIRVLEETGLLPHLNPGVLTWQDFQRLKPVAPSMGMMLETTASRLFTEKGAPHFGSPDKDPAVRLRVLEDAGRSNVPFTTGILIGIGETRAERAESVFAIRKVAREYRGIQEVIVQNFRAKQHTAMAATPDADIDAMNAAGFRGIRLNLATGGTSDPNVGRQRVQASIERMKARGWHVQMFTSLAIISAIKDLVAASPVPVVFDHFGGALGELGPTQPGFDDLLHLVQSGKAYVKISGAYRASKLAPDYPDAAPLARALIAANSERIIWGSDWPHPDSSSQPGRKATDLAPLYQIDDGRLFNQLPVWAPDAVVRKTILVDNPARLYGF